MKLTPIALAAIAAVTLTACGGGEQAAPAASSTTAPAAIQTPTPTAATTTEPSPSASTSGSMPAKVAAKIGANKKAVNLEATFCPGGTDLTADLGALDVDPKPIAAIQCPKQVMFFQLQSPADAEKFAMSMWISGAGEADYFGTLAAVFQDTEQDGDVADALRAVDRYVYA